MLMGVLGGTFNPIHLGHLQLARQAKKQFHLEKILFVPARVPPHKMDRQDIAEATDRCQMIEMALENEPSFQLSKVEIDRDAVSYTIDTLRLIKEEYPNDELCLILGADSLAEMRTWREPQEIRRLARLLVAPRRGTRGAERTEAGCEWIQMPICAISSSEIRQRACLAQSSQDLLSPAVERYIIQKRLYREQR